MHVAIRVAADECATRADPLAAAWLDVDREHVLELHRLKVKNSDFPAVAGQRRKSFVQIVEVWVLHHRLAHLLVLLKFEIFDVRHDLSHVREVQLQVLVASGDRELSFCDELHLGDAGGAERLALQDYALLGLDLPNKYFTARVS